MYVTSTLLKYSQLPPDFRSYNLCFVNGQTETPDYPRFNSFDLIHCQLSPPFWNIIYTYHLKNLRSLKVKVVSVVCPGLIWRAGPQDMTT